MMGSADLYSRQNLLLALLPQVKQNKEKEFT
jgi:hypothetical protein